jgi:hypothetical protein
LPLGIRVARWFIFKPKIPIWVKFWRVLQWKMLVFFCHLVYFALIRSVLLPFGLHYFHLVYLTFIWYISWSFGILFPFRCVAPRKIWQPCSASQKQLEKLKIQPVDPVSTCWCYSAVSRPSNFQCNGHVAVLSAKWNKRIHAFTCSSME